MSTVAKPSEKTAGHPSGDNRFKLLDAALKRHRYQPDALIEVLHTAQELFGYLKTDLLIYIAQALKLPPSRVYGVATFYHFFSFKPKGDHTCVVCMGTACYVKGADALLSSIQERAQDRDVGRHDLGRDGALPGCVRVGPDRGFRRRGHGQPQARSGPGAHERLGKTWI